MGGERYVTTVALRSERKRSSLESSCTCPVAISCKHAVAVVAEYLKALTDQRDVPIASEDDPRWADLEDDGTVFDDDRDAEDEDNDESWDED